MRRWLRKLKRFLATLIRCFQVFAAMLLVALGLVALILWQQGIITKNRLQLMGRVLRGEKITVKVIEKEVPPEKFARQIEQMRESAQRESERLKAEIEMLRKELQLEREQLEKEKQALKQREDALEQQQKAFEQGLEQHQQLLASKSFRDRLSTLELLSPESAVKFLQQISDVSLRVQLVKALKARQRSKIIAAWLELDEAEAKEIIERM
jgi:flagellar motility protein MotE (MotC chaperone)